MELVVDRLESSFKNVRVNLGRRKVGVTEQCLDNPQIGPSLQEMGSETMSKNMWANFLGDAGSNTIYM